jgi:hypothetical protein
MGVGKNGMCGCNTPSDNDACTVEPRGISTTTESLIQWHFTRIKSEWQICQRLMTQLTKFRAGLSAVL